MGEKQATEEVLDIKAQEKSFNEQLALLRKAIGESSDEEDSEDSEEESDDTQDLKKAGSDSKAKAAKAQDFDEDEEDEEEAEEEEDEEEEEKKIGKSIEEQLSEDLEAEASMDVEPFLRELVKSIDKRMDDMQKSMKKKLGDIEVLAKAQAGTLLAQASLQKAQAQTVDKIAKQDQKIGGLRRLNKARFEAADGAEPVEANGPVVLAKSMDWLKEKKIDLLEAGMIETRVNKGILGQRNDALDHKVAKLLKEAS